MCGVSLTQQKPVNKSDVSQTCYISIQDYRIAWTENTIESIGYKHQCWLQKHEAAQEM